MHQQVRTSLGTASAVQDGSGAMNLVPIEVDPLEMRRGALLELLQLLEENDYDLALAAGDAVELGGEFTFALKDHERTTQCAALLRERGYRNVRIVQVQLFEVEDRKGGLRDAISKLDPGLKVDEVYVGATQPNGLVPIQVTTVRNLDLEAAAR
jgi:hypothetical protein